MPYKKTEPFEMIFEDRKIVAHVASKSHRPSGPGFQAVDDPFTHFPIAH